MNENYVLAEKNMIPKLCGWNTVRQRVDDRRGSWIVGRQACQAGQRAEQEY
jgi:hypothetical protein